MGRFHVLTIPRVLHWGQDPLDLMAIGGLHQGPTSRKRQFPLSTAGFPNLVDFWEASQNHGLTEERWAKAVRECGSGMHTE